MLNSFRQTVATPRKWPGRDAPSSEDPRRSRFDRRLETVRIHLLRPGREEHVDACVSGHRGVARFVARVVLQILALAELRGVHEKADDHRGRFAPRGLEERDVSRMKRAHRRHESDRARRTRERGPDLGHGSQQLHASRIVRCRFASGSQLSRT